MAVVSMGDKEYLETATPRAEGGSPILSLGRGASEPSAEPLDRYEAMHTHPEPKLVWTSTATLRVTTAARDWLLPPGYGLWIPGGHEHGVAALRLGEGSVITFDPDHCPLTWAEPTGVVVGPLLRELVAHLQRSPPDDPSRPPAETLLFALLRPVPSHDIHVTLPADPRLRAIAERILADPAEARDLAFWADEVHASVRTLSRLFRADTGMSFAQWRAHVRIRAAIEHLAEGTPVKATARAVGYAKTSAFIEAFRRATGQTPGTYLKARPAPPPTA